MILIADSGSTKTSWIEVQSGRKVVTEGLNPHFTDDERFMAVCADVRRIMEASFGPQRALTIHFYGAGCGSETQAARVAQLLSAAFATKRVHVETDMLGACRAVCGKREGIVGILGTGSNACYYDGYEIMLQATSLGYILGDQGSANYVGRRLLQDYLIHCMPEFIEKQFSKAYPLSNEEFLDAVYHQPNPNRFLASLGRFAAERIDYTYCNEIIMESLNRWYGFQLIDFHIGHDYQDLYVVGGFAASIEPLLKRFANDHEITLRRVVADPIDGLRRFHRG